MIPHWSIDYGLVTPERCECAHGWRMGSILGPHDASCSSARRSIRVSGCAGCEILSELGVEVERERGVRA